MEPDRWLGIELRHLAALQAVAAEQSFGRAARRLGYTQSAVSQQIATLERIVGERLVERPGGPRPVSLTEAGQLLLRHAEAIVARLDAAEADFRALSEGESGTLRIGTYQSVGNKILPNLLRRFREQWPDVEIKLSESANDRELLDFVERGDLDLAFVIYPRIEGPFEVLQLMRDPYVLVVPADSELATKEAAPNAREIAALPLIGFRQCRSLQQVEGYFTNRGLDLNVVFRSDDNGTVQGLVGAGIGNALVPWLAIVDPDDPRVAIREIDPRVPQRLIGIAWHRDRYRTPASRAFVELAQEVCAEFERANAPASAAAA
jgi:DNA-binding transcriptional LysR family regulator